jgi:hypothetical protein
VEGTIYSCLHAPVIFLARLLKSDLMRLEVLHTSRDVGSF